MKGLLLIEWNIKVIGWMIGLMITFLISWWWTIDDGWTEGWTEGWTDGRTDGWTDGWMDGGMDGGMDGRKDGRTDGRTDGWTDGRTDGRMNGRTDGRKDGRKDGRMDGRMDGWNSIKRVVTSWKVTKWNHFLSRKSQKGSTLNSKVRKGLFIIRNQFIFHRKKSRPSFLRKK